VNYVDFKTKIKGVRFDLRSVTSRFEIEEKWDLKCEIWLNGLNLFTELFEILR